MMQINGIEPDMVEVMWPNVVEHVESACKHSNGELDTDGILLDLIDDKMRLIVMRNEDGIVAVMTIKINYFDTGKKVLTIVTTGGDNIDDWVNEIDQALTEISKREKCSEIYIVGRAGWTRKLKRLDYNTIHTTVSKKVA